MYWIGVQTKELEFVVNLGKYNVISIGNSALMPKFVVSDRRKFKEDLDMSAHCWQSDGQVNKWSRVSRLVLQKRHIQLLYICSCRFANISPVGSKLFKIFIAKELKLLKVGPYRLRLRSDRKRFQV